jgi:hypothetical protein
MTKRTAGKPDPKTLLLRRQFNSILDTGFFDESYQKQVCPKHTGCWGFRESRKRSAPTELEVVWFSLNDHFLLGWNRLNWLDNATVSISYDPYFAGKSPGHLELADQHFYKHKLFVGMTMRSFKHLCTHVAAGRNDDGYNQGQASSSGFLWGQGIRMAIWQLYNKLVKILAECDEHSIKILKNSVILTKQVQVGRQMLQVTWKPCLQKPRNFWWKPVLLLHTWFRSQAMNPVIRIIEPRASKESKLWLTGKHSEALSARRLTVTVAEHCHRIFQQGGIRCQSHSDARVKTQESDFLALNSTSKLSQPVTSAHVLGQPRTTPTGKLS